METFLDYNHGCDCVSAKPRPSNGKFSSFLTHVQTEIIRRTLCKLSSSAPTQEVYPAYWFVPLISDWVLDPPLSLHPRTLDAPFRCCVRALLPRRQSTTTSCVGLFIGVGRAWAVGDLWGLGWARLSWCLLLPPSFWEKTFIDATNEIEKCQFCKKWFIKNK